ncbi:MAG: SprT family zinc-dependent metalloprotease [Bacteroidales bacterium]|nr:SprT family zinc-dependent metalloprotease [Bacteroidales bacterium]
MQYIELGNIKIEVVQKDIKNIHLSVYPPDGNVKIAAPIRMDLDTIRVFAINKLQWIKKQQELFRNQEREAPREYLSKESHYFQGKRYLLKIIEQDSKPKVVLTHSKIELYLRPGTSTEKRKEIIEEWYREEMKKTIPKMIEKWEKIIGVKVNEFGIKKMRTKWGTCNTEAKRIWINLELAKKPLECLEYIVVHELIHLLERRHNDIFKNYLNEFMPKWRFYRDELNRLPFRHTEWKY